ncbi:hypothetical protein L914_05073 [Phytophthora nicotianae]|uniref:Uncharacterized protein n=2 Tax=Phytophthora nicotianae TaxID=4792 RepID=V9FLW2_PHYNI|nr:hypothetical protein F443_05255 [Phytophthora nicotianae P1569]ETM50993.1 hypothetical protein L914_05073 [Phytophthora nicotianae]
MQVRGLIAALSDACSKNELLRIYFHRVRAELESLVCIPRSVAEASVKTVAAVTTSAKSLKDQLRCFQVLAQQAKTRPPMKRLNP